MSLDETFFNDASDEQTGRRFVKFNKQKETQQDKPAKGDRSK